MGLPKSNKEPEKLISSSSGSVMIQYDPQPGGIIGTSLDGEEKPKKREFKQFERDELLMLRKAVFTQLSAYRKAKDRPNSITAEEYPEFEKLKEKINKLLK